MEILNTSTVDDKKKEFCALGTMHNMLLDYALDNNITAEQALFLFSSTYVYDALFDFSTEIWKEGPDYLRSIFEEALAKQQAQ